MKNVIVKKADTLEILQEAKFEDNDPKMQEWLELLNTKGWQDLKPAWIEDVKNDNGDIIATVPHEAQFIVEIEDITAVHAFEQLMISMEKKGTDFEDACHGCLRIIGGYNDTRQLSLEQIMSMASTFSSIEQFLNRRMPKTAKAAITALVPDGDIVTEELKNLLLLKLKDY